MSNTIVSDHPFTPEEQERLRVLAGLIVPASAEYNVPGADEEPVFADILQSAVAQQAEIKAALAFAGNLDGPLEDNVPLLQTSEVVAPVVVLVMQCYYRADAVLEQAASPVTSAGKLRAARQAPEQIHREPKHVVPRED